MFRVALSGRTLAAFAKRSKFSTNAAQSAKKELSHEEKAAEVNKGFSAFLKKYGVVFVPGLFMTLLTVDVINRMSDRMWVEEHWPAYIELLREHYGFKDEDNDERLRNKSLLYYYSKPVTMQVNCKDGTSVAVAVPDAKAKFEDIALNNEYVSSNARSLRDLYCTGLVSFPDQDEDDEGNPFAGPKPVKTRSFDEEPKSAQVQGLPWTVNSLWEQSLFQSNASRDPAAKYMSTYENVVGNMFVGLQQYREHGNNLVVGARNSPDGTNQTRPKRAHNKSYDKNIMRRLALDKIQQLEYQLAELNNEKRIGIRDMDSVDEDIKQKKAEISDLKKKYVNFFYYF